MFMAELKTETVVFYYDGATIMGKMVLNPDDLDDGGDILNNFPAGTSADKSLRFVKIGDFTSASQNKILVLDPVKVEFSLTLVTGGSADLGWKLVPFFYNALWSNSSDNSYRISYFAFPKDKVVLSTVHNAASGTGAKIDETRIKAYNQICAARPRSK